jgi:hypothetical protein
MKPFKKIYTVSTAVALVLAAGNAWADNTITFEPATNGNGANNSAVINASLATSTTLSIEQVSDASGTGNKVGDNPDANHLVINGAISTIHIGQGAYWDGSWHDSTSGAHGNLVKGTISGGSSSTDVTIGQRGNSNTVTLTRDTAGSTTVQQGKLWHGNR